MNYYKGPVFFSTQYLHLFFIRLNNMQLKEKLFHDATQIRQRVRKTERVKKYTRITDK